MYFSSLAVLGALSLSYHVSSIHAYDTSPPSPEALSALFTVKNILSLKNLLIANHEFDTLPQIYAEDINLQAPEWGVSITGLANVTKYLIENDGQHVMILENSSQFVELVSPTVARALSNTQETYFGQKDKTGKAMAYWERFEDFLRLEGGKWWIYKTVITNVGGPIGDEDAVGLSGFSRNSRIMRGSNRLVQQQL